MGDHRRVGELAEANGEVDALLDEIEGGVGEDEVEDERWVAAREIGEQRNQVLLREADGGGDPQGAARLVIAVAGDQRGALEFVDQRRDAVEVGERRLGRRQPPRRAVEQAHAEPHSAYGDAAATGTATHETRAHVARMEGRAQAPDPHAELGERLAVAMVAELLVVLDVAQELEAARQAGLVSDRIPPRSTDARTQQRSVVWERLPD